MACQALACSGCLSLTTAPNRPLSQARVTQPQDLGRTFQAGPDLVASLSRRSAPDWCDAAEVEHPAADAGGNAPGGALAMGYLPEPELSSPGSARDNPFNHLLGCGGVQQSASAERPVHQVWKARS